MKKILMLKYAELIKKGNFYVGRRILWFLQSGHIGLGLGDIDWEVQTILDNIGLHGIISANGNTARYYLPTMDVGNITTNILRK